MKARDVFTYAFGAIRLRKLRAGLTTLGVIIGIAAIVALLSISQGLQYAITKQLQTGFSTDTLIVSAGRGFLPTQFIGMDSGFSLITNDTDTINQIEDVTTSVAVIRKIGYIKSNERETTTYLIGVDFETYAEIYSQTFVAKDGSIPMDPENMSVIIGQRISDPFANDTSFFNVADVVELKWTNGTARPPRNETYTGRVDAVLKEAGGFGLTGPSDSAVYLPIMQAQRFFSTDECDTIIVKLNNDEQTTIDHVSQTIREAFSNEVSVTSSTAVLGILSNVFFTIELFLGGIAAISLLVAGIGIMNIMIVSLMERTREIGILKALGMKRRTVLAVFLSEAVIIGLLGATIGIGSGWLLANGVSRVFSGGGGFMQSAQQQNTFSDGMTITPVLTPTLFIGALAFGVLVSVIFAFYPAWRASNLKPVDALRYE